MRLQRRGGLGGLGECWPTPNPSGVDPRQLYVDDRLTGMCVYCCGQADTRDHVPSEILLDKPYPPDLPVVDACDSCNKSFSFDEEYVACFLECVICGTAVPGEVKREKIKQTLVKRPPLQRRIVASQSCDEDGNIIWEPEVERIKSIVMKLARGHAAFELYPIFQEPTELTIAPLATFSEKARETFMNFGSGALNLFPEIGTRALWRGIKAWPDHVTAARNWIVVQRGRYRYAVTPCGSGLLVRILLSDYCACSVYWNEL